MLIWPQAAGVAVSQRWRAVEEGVVMACSRVRQNVTACLRYAAETPAVGPAAFLRVASGPSPTLLAKASWIVEQIFRERGKILRSTCRRVLVALQCRLGEHRSGDFITRETPAGELLIRQAGERQQPLGRCLGLI